jgi:signal transduction histidine kinase
MSEERPTKSKRLILTTRFALGLGFGGLILIMTLGGIAAQLVLRHIRRDDDRIRGQFLFRNHILNEIKSELYLSGTYIRDYLLDPDPSRAEAHRVSLEAVGKEMEIALRSYAAQVEPAETTQLAALRTELSNYWQILGPSLKWSGEERRLKGYLFLRDAVYPRRTAMLEIAGRISDLNEQQLNAGNTRIASLLLDFQNRLAMALVATVILSLGMAGYTMWKILGLESNAESRYREAAESRKQLTNLSAKLLQAQETERRALSRELHDEVGQSLSGVILDLHNISNALATSSPGESRLHIDNVKGAVENTVRVVRNMALLLRPSMLDDLGLVPALRWQARELSKRTPMDVSVAAQWVSDDLPDDYKTCVYRVVQEALHNCSRHSLATTVRIGVTQEPGRLLLSIRDDGKGFHVEQSKGLGLLGIEERVGQLGGKCEIQSEPGNGTLLAIELPFHSKEA